MDAERARAETFRALEKKFPGRAFALVVCAHATTDASGFTRDPVFPDKFINPGETDLTKSDLAEANQIVRRTRAASVGSTSPADASVSFADGRAVWKYGSTTLRTSRRAHDVMLRSYRGTSFASDAFRVLYRYSAFARKGSLQDSMFASIPPEIYARIRDAEPRAVEGFSSPFNRNLMGAGYYGLFPDVEAPFGCLGNFFRIAKPAPLIVCNPPFDRCVLNAFVSKALGLLDKGPGAFLAILPAFDVSGRVALNGSGRCKGKYPTDYDTDVHTARLQTSRHHRWSQLYCKESFPYYNAALGKYVPYASTLVVMLSSYKRGGVSPSALRKALPPPDVW